MGGFYGSIQVRTADRAAVLEAVQAIANAERRFLVGPQLGAWVGIYPDNSGQDISLVQQLAQHLAAPLIQLVVHDDDLFVYEAYAQGEPLDSFDSRPDYFQPVTLAEREAKRGRPERLLASLAPEASASQLADLLDAAREKKVWPAYQLLELFAELLAIRNAVTSFEYLENGETEAIVGWRKFSGVPDNRAAKRAAARALKKSWEDLRERGVIALRDDRLRVKTLHTDVDGSLLALRGGVPFHDGEPSSGCVERWADPWTSPPEVMLDAGLDQAITLAADRSGRWLATVHSYGDWRARVWDRKSRSLAFEAHGGRAMSWAGFTADSQYLVTLGNELGVTALATGGELNPPAVELAARTAVIDDSRRLVAVASQYEGLALLQLPAVTWLDTGKRGAMRSELIYGMSLDIARDHLVMGTQRGVCVYRWSVVVAGNLYGSKPLCEIRLPFVYASVLDDARNRVFYGGVDGTIEMLDLTSGAQRTLLALPGETSVFSLALARGGRLAVGAGARPSDRGKSWSALLILDLEKIV